MSIVDKVGWVALVITVLYTCLGLPAQIRENYRKKTTEGLSPFMLVLLLCTFSSWVVYGAVKEHKDWYVIISNFPGAVGAAIMLLQTRIYKRAK